MNFCKNLSYAFTYLLDGRVLHSNLVLMVGLIRLWGKQGFLMFYPPRASYFELTFPR